MPDIDTDLAKELSAEDRDRQQFLGWLRIKYGEGLAALTRERAWEQGPLAQSYVEGKQGMGKARP